jgi:hypothetical protein
MHMNLTIKTAALTTLALLGIATLPRVTQAQTLIYDNGTFAPVNALSITSSAIADDFVFVSTKTFDQARVWVLANSAPNSLNGFSGTLSWLIRSNNAGIPGGVLSSGTVSGGAITPTNTGVDLFGFRIFQLDFGISSTTLTAGTYWFSIKENGLTAAADGSNVFWLDSGSSAGFDTRTDDNPVNPTLWFPPSPGIGDRAFQFLGPAVSSAPEPGTLALLTLGSVALLARRQNRRK